MKLRALRGKKDAGLRVARWELLVGRARPPLREMVLSRSEPESADGNGGDDGPIGLPAMLASAPAPRPVKMETVLARFIFLPAVVT